MPQHLLHIIGALIALAALKGAAALTAGSGALFAQGGYTAAETVVLVLALTSFKAAPGHAGKQLRDYILKAGEKPVIIPLLLALLIFTGGCALLWTGYYLPFAGRPAFAPQALYFAALILLSAEIIVWRWVLSKLNRLHSLFAATAGQSFRRDLLMLIPAFAGALAVQTSIPAADMLISAAIAVLVLLKALKLVYSALDAQGSGLDKGHITRN